MQAKKLRAISPWAAIDAIVNANPEPSGPEWFTAADYTTRYGGSVGGNHNKLKADSRFDKWTGVANTGNTRRMITKFKLKCSTKK